MKPVTIEGDLGTFLGALAARSLDRAAQARPKRPASADIETLKAAAVRYFGPAPFEPGDLVTPRADSPLKDAGRPHIVLEVDPMPQSFRTPIVHGDPNASIFGARRDLRVAVVCDCEHGEVVAHWVESWHFEPFMLPGETVAPSEAA
jgi:hypothetical protein